MTPGVHALLAIADAPEAPARAYHICHPRPPAFHEVIALLLQALAIEDRLRIEYAAELGETATWTEKMIARAFKPYFAYLDARAVFDLTNTRSLLPAYDDCSYPLAWNTSSAWSPSTASRAGVARAILPEGLPSGLFWRLGPR